MSDTIISGKSINLPNGGKVWGAEHEGTTLWRFTSPDGVDTDIRLSHDAVNAVRRIHKAMADGPSHWSIIIDALYFHNLPRLPETTGSKQT